MPQSDPISENKQTKKKTNTKLTKKEGVGWIWLTLPLFLQLLGTSDCIEALVTEKDKRN